VSVARFAAPARAIFAMRLRSRVVCARELPLVVAVDEAVGELKL
jgi:hypothetical protein